ncbi:hypothetical protein [Xanthomonas hortorum]|uniref:hypothetical protein n=3 Tax=Xanthomonas TaxID=338 RepID=UPI0012FE4B3D|nr:hypothetical protein [Xanthomonas hortorum]MCE4308385.1 hypothetical protein [Xanthomonas hortorum pv. vitians]MCE4313369.1 hypothetical protein [Xanthomonas hortorum pv. vitians]MCE4338906.1 hypothetical protein [Xanthomonas hortorum pv. vitians]MCE4344116.1 hypothetical protein [Xanthomonas hortorum pv. vitians]MCE4512545.1 hypothetical protein [Xanthomonas hortorum pv. vitians]
MGLLIVAAPLLAKPKCEVDSFTGKKGCVYGTGAIGMAGVGNQIITADGQMGFQRAVMFVYKPLDVSSILFRVDGQRTIRLSAKNTSRPDVHCSGQLCTWSWTVLAPISGDFLKELAGADELIMVMESDDHQRSEEMTMKKGGRIFAKFLEDIQANEPSVLDTSKAEAFVQVGTDLQPYTPPAVP